MNVGEWLGGGCKEGRNLHHGKGGDETRYLTKGEWRRWCWALSLIFSLLVQSNPMDWCVFLLNHKKEMHTENAACLTLSLRWLNLSSSAQNLQPHLHLLINIAPQSFHTDGETKGKLEFCPGRLRKSQRKLEDWKWWWKTLDSFTTFIRA